MSQPIVTVKGTWPILKYTVKTQTGYAVVMIDDESGTVLVDPGDQLAFRHWWGESGRGTKSLREFLIKANPGYFMDKFSYGLNRWCPDLALKELKEELYQHLGGDDWPEEITECLDQLEGHGHMSSDLWHWIVYGCSEITDLVGYDNGFGSLSDHQHVKFFIETKWPALVEFWKQELAAESKPTINNKEVKNEI